MEIFCNAIFQHKNGFSTLHTTPECAESIYLWSIFDNWKDAYDQCFPFISEENIEAIRECLSLRIDGRTMLKFTHIPFAFELEKTYPMHSFQNWVSAFTKIVEPCISKLFEIEDFASKEENGGSIRGMITSRGAMEDMLDDLSYYYGDEFSKFYLNIRCNMMDGDKKESCDLSSLSVDQVENLDSLTEKQKKRVIRENNYKNLLRVFRISETGLWLMLHCFTYMLTPVFTHFITMLTSDQKILRKKVIEAIFNIHQKKVDSGFVGKIHVPLAVNLITNYR